MHPAGVCTSFMLCVYALGVGLFSVSYQVTGQKEKMTTVFGFFTVKWKHTHKDTQMHTHRDTTIYEANGLLVVHYSQLVLSELRLWLHNYS